MRRLRIRLARPLHSWRSKRERRARGRSGEQRVAAVLDDFAARHRLKARHAIPLETRQGRRGDLDHVLAARRRPRFIVAIETKAEHPRPGHLEQVRANAQRASRRHFHGVPQYRIVVHPNSGEPITYDVATAAARMGLEHLPGYLRALLDGAHPERLAR